MRAVECNSVKAATEVVTADFFRALVLLSYVMQGLFSVVKFA